jgi:hypothetical protein
MMDWKETIRAVAPALATALGGPLAGVAVQQISASLLGKPDGKDAEIASAISSGGADALLKLKQADNEFAEKMKGLDVDLEGIAAKDRDSARQLAVHDVITPRFLAVIVTCGFFGVLAYLIKFGKPEAGGDVLLVLVGSLGTAWTSIVAFYFGSSAGSQAKDKMLAKG